MLIDANEPLRQNGFKRWLFYPGMAFGSTQKWWGDFGIRDFPHEGIDFCLYEGEEGQIFHFNAGSAVPVVASGTIRAVFKDYLGHAIVVDHGPLARIEIKSFYQSMPTPIRCFIFKQACVSKKAHSSQPQPTPATPRQKFCPTSIFPWGWLTLIFLLKTSIGICCGNPKTSPYWIH